MKFKRLFSISMAIILTLAGALWQPGVVSAGSGWLPIGSAGFSTGPAQWTSLALDKNNTPYVAYEDGTSGKATVVKFNGAAWETVGSAGFSAGQVSFVNLVLDSNGTPYVAYQGDFDHKWKLTVMKFDGAAWVSVGSPDISAAGADYISLALDSNNTPYVAYEDGSSGKATVMKYTDGAWVFVGSGGISTYSAFHLSLKLDKNNTPYLAYSMVMDFWHNQTTVSKFTGTTWVTVGPPYFSGEKSSTLYNSLAFDSNNTPYVAYQDNTTNKDSVMKFNGSAWVPVGSVISATGGGSWTSLALDKNDTPYLAYQETYWGTVIDYKATVRKFNGTDWETLGPVGFSIAGAEYTSLALDSNNTPFVAYDDGGINKGTLMKYYPVLPPTDFNKTSPSNAATDVTPNLVLSWGASTGADSYEYCVDTINNNVCDSNWISAGVKTSVSPTGLKTKTTYYWQSRAVNTGGTTYADASTWESFTTGNNKVYLPYLRR